MIVLLVTYRVPCTESYELLSGEELAESPISIDATFDEFKLDLAIRYQGRLPERAEASFGAQQLMLGEGSVAILSSVLLHRLADRVRMKASGASCEIELHFEH